MTGRSQSFSSSEAVASMIDGEHNDQGFTTSNLLHGHASPAIKPEITRSSSNPRRSSSLHNASTSRSTQTLPLPPVLQLLQGVGVIELLEQDDRPTFIIDLANPANFCPGPLHIIFVNASLRAAPSVSNLLSADTAAPGHSASFSRFKAWVMSFVKDSESMDVSLPSLSYGGISWTCSTLRRRFRLVSGNMSAVSIIPTSPCRVAQASSILDQRARVPIFTEDLNTLAENPTPDRISCENGDQSMNPLGSHGRSHSEPGSKSESIKEPLAPQPDDYVPSDLQADGARLAYDWTRVPLDTPNLPPHIRFARSVDWESTPLGALDQWPADLRSMSNMIMGSSRPAAIYWGPEFIVIYNEAYISVAGQKHPRLMGMRYRDAWSEIWSDLEPIFERAWTACQTTMKHDDRLLINRDGYIEETFFNWSIVPLIGSDGSVVALYNPAIENTRRKVNERRTLSLHEVGERTSKARDVRSFWAQVKAGLESNEFDIPFALIYSVTRDPESATPSADLDCPETPHQVILEGSIGVSPDHPLAAPSINLRSTNDGFAPYLRECVVHSAGPIVLRREDETLPADLVDGLAWRGSGGPCRTIVVFPVRPAAAGDAVVGFVVLGINPRRPYDDDDELFVNILSRQLASSLVSVILFEEEIKRGQEAAQLAALDHEELSTQLQLRTQEAVESEYRFTRMAEFAPVGMFIADARGRINYCNDMWWEISKHPRQANTVDGWMESIWDEDRTGVEEIWTKLVHEKVAVTHEFRFKRSHHTPDSQSQSADTWVLMSAYPEKDETGCLKCIFGCITDISQQKWAEDFEKQRREEAVEMKRQQENFIDITSHEMRNPLSAVLQCADEISGSLTNFRSENALTPTQAALDHVLDNCIEAANTISLCANHQKRIVDDVLTLSKLDSQLLLVTPVDARPVTVVENVLRMFEAELKSHDIKGEFRIDKSYLDLGCEWYKLDPSRLRQVIINLMTNAIRFTQGQEKREIVISLGASRYVSEPGFSYFPNRQNDSVDITDEADWGTGEKINLYVAVSDTGSGLDDDEKNILFQRFSQASPRTHVQYGGSGLGLFICRTLTELQGGQIGVNSTKDVGSTFTFYIKSRRTSRPRPSPDAASSTPSRANTPNSVTNTTRLQYSTTSDTSAPQPPIITTTAIEMTPTDTRDANAPPPIDILIVEDNLVNQKVLQRQLRRSGNNTHVANHGGEALEVLRKSRFWSRPDTDDDINISVILMDLEMPVMDGMTCARKIRELEREGAIMRHIPILAVTAYARREQIANAKEAGIDDVISKPFRISELIPKIEELISKCNTSPVVANAGGLDANQPLQLRPPFSSIVRNPTF